MKKSKFQWCRYLLFLMPGIVSSAGFFVTQWLFILAFLFAIYMNIAISQDVYESMACALPIHTIVASPAILWVIFHSAFCLAMIDISVVYALYIYILFLSFSQIVFMCVIRIVGYYRFR